MFFISPYTISENLFLNQQVTHIYFVPFFLLHIHMCNQILLDYPQFLLVQNEHNKTRYTIPNIDNNQQFASNTQKSFNRLVQRDLISPPNTTSSHQKDIPIPGWAALTTNFRIKPEDVRFVLYIRLSGSDRWRRYIKKQQLEALSEEKHPIRLERIAKKDQLDFEQARYLKTSKHK